MQPYLAFFHLKNAGHMEIAIILKTTIRNNGMQMGLKFKKAP